MRRFLDTFAQLLSSLDTWAILACAGLAVHLLIQALG
jgi:hypothetical protein